MISAEAHPIFVQDLNSIFISKHVYMYVYIYICICMYICKRKYFCCKYTITDVTSDKYVFNKSVAYGGAKLLNKDLKFNASTLMK